MNKVGEGRLSNTQRPHLLAPACVFQPELAFLRGTEDRWRSYSLEKADELGRLKTSPLLKFAILKNEIMLLSHEIDVRFRARVPLLLLLIGQHARQHECARERQACDASNECTARLHA